MKTDLSKILSISGQSGLFRYIARAKSGVVAESLATGVKSTYGLQSKMSALTDISIFTDEGEVKLREVFLKMQEVLGEDRTITGKASQDELKAFFEEVLPDYDRERFYPSHMKKVVDWYNCLKDHASLDFEDEEKGEESAEEE
ncbi:MAG: DUF5606 domain-containing protein [Bacteroidales bacterium]|nr:DUF5606 domain-containing protein [Bacteroidales bacterium]